MPDPCDGQAGGLRAEPRGRLEPLVFGVLRSNHRRYGLALLATLLALLLRLGLGEAVQGTGTFLYFIPAVMLSAWYGGFGPGLLATLAGAVAGAYWLIDPPS